MSSKSLPLLLLIALSTSLQAQSDKSGAENAPPPQNGGDFSSNPNARKVPQGVIIVKSAVPSATDSVTPLPEAGSIAESVYTNRYFHLSYPFPADWYEKFKGPPPSDLGYYVLAQLRPADTFKGSIKGTVLVSAQDLFFTTVPAVNAMELLKYTKETLRPEYKVEQQPAEVKISNQPFVRFDYVAPVADLHFYVLATEIRCHAVEFTFTSRDPRLLEALILDMNRMKLAAMADGDLPVCIKNYATGNRVTYKIDPVLTDRKFNPIPVRIIISKEGKVKHVHFISAFPDQAEIITSALLQWTFKPYLRNGQPVELETGIMFGQSPLNSPASPSKKTAAVSD